MKKVWKGAAAAIAALSLGVTGFVGATSAYADETAGGTTSGTTVDQTKGSITVTDNAATARTYNAYQIFAGGYSDGTLSNVTWGTGITEAGQTALITQVRTQVAAYNDGKAPAAQINFSDTPTAADVAKAIADLGLGANSAGAKALANVFKTAGTLSDTKTALTKNGNEFAFSEVNADTAESLNLCIAHVIAFEYIL